MSDDAKPRRWRRANSAGERSHRIVLRLDDAEYVRLKAEAEVRQCSMQAVLMRAVSADGNEAARRLKNIENSLYSARRGLARAGANVNQAVKLEHTRRAEGAAASSGAFEDDVRAALAELRQSVADIERVLREVDQ